MKCYHCGQTIAEDGLVVKTIADEEKQFCCHGCAGACEAIYEAGLAQFYDKADRDAMVTPLMIPSDLELYDHDEVQVAYVSSLGDVREIVLMSESIHCAACVWLIEHRLAKTAGIQLASVNFTTRRIKVRWDNRQIRLSQILHILAQLGYVSIPYDPQTSQKALEDYNRGLLYRFAFAAFAMMNIMWVAISLYFGANDDPEYKQFFHWVALGLATPTLLYSGQPFFIGAWQALRSRRLGMDVSISLGILTTYFYSLYITVMPTAGGGEVYFDTLVDFMFFLLLGRYLESISKTKAIDATHRLLALQPKVAKKQLPDGSEKLEAVRLLTAGDRVWVHPGDRVPVDGVVLEGESHLNESMLTGEAKPIHKRVGDKVSAGTHNQEGALLVEVQHILAETSLGRIIALVEDAQGSKAPIARLADRVIPWFVSVTLSLALFALIFWWIEVGLDTAIMAATAVLIVTCPCAFGLATPMAIAVASGVGARLGVLIKNGTVLERLSQVTHVVFDKTGTLTQGNMQVAEGRVWSPNWSEAQIWQGLAVVEKRSEHALAEALVSYSVSHYPTTEQVVVEGFVARSGLGVEARVDGQLWQVGSLNWMRQLGVSFADFQQGWMDAQGELGRTMVCVLVDGQLVAGISLGDVLRPDAIEVVSELKARGIEVMMITGDHAKVAQSFAQQLGGMPVQAEVMPADKDLAVKSLQTEGRMVVFVGDGINDAPALVRADVGIALGSGTEVSVDSAQVVLLNNQLKSVLLALDLSRVTLRTIKQNIAMSLLYNLIMVPLAVAAKLTPLIAAIGMPISSLLVIGNAARIRNKFVK